MSVFANLSRMIDFGNIIDQAFTGTAVRVGPFPNDELILDTNSRCYVKVGDSTVVATVGSGNLTINTTGKYIIRIPYGSYVSVIQDTTPGKLNIAPVLK